MNPSCRRHFKIPFQTSQKSSFERQVEGRIVLPEQNRLRFQVQCLFLKFGNQQEGEEERAK